MKKFHVEVSDELAAKINEAAGQKNLSMAAYIEEILSRFIINPHILDNEDAKRGYEETAQINLDWANL